MPEGDMMAIEIRLCLAEAPTAYEALPKIASMAHVAAAKFGFRMTVRGFRSHRCGMWHYITAPQLDQPIRRGGQ
jgi:hypothetical protein